MSRFLAYGVFVPSTLEDGVKGTVDSTDNMTLRWKQVGSKWVKVGPDGQVVDPPKSLPAKEASTAPTLNINSSKSFHVVEGSEGTGDYGLNKSSRDDAKLRSSRASYFANSTAGSWETPPPTSDSCDDDGTPCSSAGSTRLGSRGKWSSSVTGSGGDDDARSSGEGTEGAEGDAQHSSDLLENDANGAGRSTPSRQTANRPELTARITSGTQGKGDREKNPFGEDDDDALATSLGDLRCEALDANAGPSGTASGDVKCVGERAPLRRSRAHSDGKRSKARIKRSASGSNVGGSPRKSKPEKRVVETRDVACQWDGSEMGEDEEPALPPQVELPDTPDCRALTAVLRLYDHARLENKRMGVASSRPGWGVEENIEDWEGVYLDTEDRVVALDVDGDPENRQAVLIGPLPVELAEMDRLEQLTMRRHRFKGRIPGELGKLSRLTHLNLSNCRLIGPLPSELGALVNLVVLNLSWNFLSGELPTELGKLINLEELLINSNSFSGSIPSEIGRMKKLKRFNAGHNIAISGPLPPELYRLSQLVVLDLRHNKISGRIPGIYGRLAKLQQIWLQDNEISEDIPAELARLPRLEMLHLANNKLSGVIPMAIRGHPKYRAFKILPGNVALGERVAPNEREVEAATRRKPTTNAMEFAPAAQAQAMQRAQQQQHQEAMRRVSSLNTMSPSPSADGIVPGTSGRRSTVGSSDSHSNSPVRDGEEAMKRHTSRGGMSRRIRSMRQIMGKKQSPPASPLPSESDTREESLSPVERIIVPGSGSSSPSPRAEITGGSTQGSRTVLADIGKTLVEETEEDMDEERDDVSPNATESISTGNGASSHASPARNHGEGDGDDEEDDEEEPDSYLA